MSAASTRSRERIRRICESASDSRELRLQLVAELRLVVGFDAYAFVLTDPLTCVGSAPLADVPCLPELPQLIRLKYLTQINRWTELGSTSVGLLWEATAGELTRSPLWRDLLRRYDVGDVASLVLRDRFGCWGFLDLWRSGSAARFRREDALFLSAIAEPVTLALRRTLTGAFVARPSPPLPRLGPVVLLLSPNLDVVAQTPETHEYLRVLVPPPRGVAPIPASAYNVAAQVLAVEAGADTHPPRTRVHLSDGLWLTLRAARIGAGTGANDPDIAVTIEESGPSERLDLFTRVFGLSARERELVGHLAAGRDTRAVAERMYLSEYTVQDHLKAVFAKTGTNNRRTLLSRALGVTLSDREFGPQFAP